MRKYSEKRNQPYLEAMYKAIFILGYYGLMRVSELTFSQHIAKAANVHVAMNKNKIMVVLYSSKTHSMGQQEQKIKISANDGCRINCNFCPFKTLRRYITFRKHIVEPEDPFFVFRDGTPVLPKHATQLLKLALSNLGLDNSLYGMHSLRIGRTTDLVKFNYSLDQVKRAGRWHSNVVYKYIRG